MWTTTEVLFRTHRLFAEISDHTVSTLARSAFMELCPEDTVIAREGVAADYLFFVTSGSVELFTELGSRESSIAILVPVAVFFVAPVIGDVPNPMSARTVEQTCLVKLPAKLIRAVADRDAALRRALDRELAAHYAELVETLRGLKLQRSIQRLAHYLVSQHEDQGAVGRVTLPVRKQTLASLLGITPSVLSRAFAALRPYGVRVKGYDVELTKPYDLVDFAKSCGS